MHPGGFEPPTARFVAEYSIQLSYGCIGITTLLLIQCRSTCRNTDKDGASGRITRLRLALRAVAEATLSSLVPVTRFAVSVTSFSLPAQEIWCIREDSNLRPLGS